MFFIIYFLKTNKSEQWTKYSDLLYSYCLSVHWPTARKRVTFLQWKKTWHVPQWKTRAHPAHAGAFQEFPCLSQNCWEWERSLTICRKCILWDILMRKKLICMQECMAAQHLQGVVSMAICWPESTRSDLFLMLHIPDWITGRSNITTARWMAYSKDIWMQS